MADHLAKLKNIRDLIQRNNIKIIDFRFIDLPGTWQHFSVTDEEIGESLFKEGTGFDGSSIRGFKQIQESDMVLLPDVDTAFVDPFCKHPTLTVICDVCEPGLRPYGRSPRPVAKRAEEYLVSSGIADRAYFGPEIEFFVFDDVRYNQDSSCGFYYIDSVEAAWNTGSNEGPNLGHKARKKEGYFPVPPTDTLQDFRSEVVLKLIDIGVQTEMHHHEVATAGQCEIDIRFDTLQAMADKVRKYKYVVKNTARQHGKVATFMPKPVFEDNGTGMHVHQSLWKGNSPLFYDENGYASLSELARYYIGGILEHAPALLALCAPTTNSYKRLVPGYEAPVNLVYSARNRSAIVRIPAVSDNPQARRLEFRAPDPSANPYLAFAAMVMAGLDGIKNRIDPGDPADENLFALSAERQGQIASVPASLEGSLAALQEDHEFLLQGEVFTKDLVDAWVGYKLEREADPVRLRPHPHEFYLYFDV